MSFTQELMNDVTANQDTNQAILDMLEIDENHELRYHIYQVVFEGKTIHCCLSGGVIENNEIQFTAVGLAAFEALTNIESENKDIEYYAEVIEPGSDLCEQLESVFAKVPNGARVCFLGDITGELKAELGNYFTLLH